MGRMGRGNHPEAEVMDQVVDHVPNPGVLHDQELVLQCRDHMVLVVEGVQEDAMGQASRTEAI